MSQWEDELKSQLTQEVALYLHTSGEHSWIGVAKVTKHTTSARLTKPLKIVFEPEGIEKQIEAEIESLQIQMEDIKQHAMTEIAKLSNRVQNLRALKHEN